jgi:transposase
MLTRFKGFSSLKAWGLKIAKKRGHKRACLAVARKLSVIMHAMWRDGSTFRFKATETQEKPQGKRAPKLLAATA